MFYEINVKHLVITLLTITTLQRKNSLHITNSGKSIIINDFVQYLNSSQFFNKTTESLDSVLAFERENAWTVVINLFRQFYVIANINLNLVVQIRIILLMLRLGSKK